jgi:sigma-B regulation protein RsbU (phosphoserine phosphatase)
MIMNETIFSAAEARNDSGMRAVGRDMIQGKSGFVPFRSLVTGKQCWMVYTPLAASGWSLGVLFPQDELMADITRLNQTVIFVGLAGFLFIFALIVLIARSITRPLRTLSMVTQDIATGNLDVEVPPIRSKDEVGRLAEAFDHMRRSLKQYVRDLTTATAAKERIESELKIARDIQMGILPKTFPPFPDRKEFDIFAILEPAREVGGDLYDFFFMDQKHLCFAIGDVSDKGVPAALFMAVTKTLIKTQAAHGLTPETVLTRVNEDLSQDNPSVMFVTLFLGILNIQTGELVYCNGGHNPPYLLRSGQNPEALKGTGGLALGVTGEACYRSQKIMLEKGDALFLYTDGVTEAMNGKDELFSEQALEQSLSLLGDKPIKQMIEGVMEEVREFCKGVPQTDDITIMTLRFNGNGS